MQYQYGGYSLQSQTMGAPNAKYKTMLCRHYEATNQCSVGAKCQFAHGQAELRSINDPIPTSAMTAISQTIAQPTPQHNYKSIQCKYFGMGFCKNGTNCTFIHGIHQFLTIKKEDPDPYMQQQMPYDMQQQMPQQQTPQSQQQQYQQPQQQQYYGNQNQQYANNQTYQQPQQNNPTLQQYLDQQVLLMILKDLEQVFSYREDLANTFKDAIQQVQQGNNSYGSQAIKGIVHQSDLSNEEKAQYQVIYDRAKVYLGTLQQQYQVQKQQ